MTYIVVDFEFNQSYDFKRGKKGISNEVCPFEIIQIGAIKLDSDFNEIGRFNALIKPTIYKRIHPFVEKITSLTDHSFNNSSDFIKVMSDFSEFVGNNAVFCVWGENDIKSLYRNMVYHNAMFLKLPIKYIDIQDIISKKINYTSGGVIGLRNAVELFDIPIQDTFHDALNDAAYTAEIFKLFKDEKLSITKFDPSILKKIKKTITRGIDTISLYAMLEKELGRKLSPKEKILYRKTYLMGRDKEFDN